MPETSVSMYLSLAVRGIYLSGKYVDDGLLRCNVVRRYQRFEVKYYLHLQG